MGRLHSLSLAVRRWRQFLANHGVAATTQTLLSAIRRRLGRSSGRRASGETETAAELWRNADAAPASIHPFDARFGTETSGLIWGEHLRTGHPQDAWNTAYYGIAPSAFSETLRLLQQRAVLDWRRLTFIDLGSGKGRAVLLASEYPFARVLGVELSPQLHAAAVANLALFPASTVRAARVEVLQADAAAFPWGLTFPGSLLFFLYNPFSRPVLDGFLARLKASVQDEPREVYLLYINPELDAALTRHNWIEKLWQETIAIGEADRLADRFGSTTETVAAYRCNLHNSASSPQGLFWR